MAALEGSASERSAVCGLPLSAGGAEGTDFLVELVLGKPQRFCPGEYMYCTFNPRASISPHLFLYSVMPMI